MEKPVHLPKQLRRTGLVAAIALGAVAVPVQAKVFAPLVMPAMSAAIATAAACPISPAISPVSASEDRRAPSKASAILGGGTSALEAMRAQQASFESMGPLIPGAGPTMEAIAAPAPVISVAFAPLVDCARAPGTAASRLTDITRPLQPGMRGSEDFLASRRIPIGKTMFDTSWSRVSGERPLFGREIKRLIGGKTDLETRLAAVNGWVNRRIAYTEDKDLFGKADYWAGARRTLALGKGDCEDYALLKMQLLAAAGVSREDMFLTVAVDLVRRADHAVLIVRTPDGYRMLDNNTDTVLDASEANDYRPVLSFNNRKSWLHGY